jgi:tetratricopeptide (TPR) repeat protein
VKRVREIVAARSEDAELQLLLAQAELGADHHAQAEQAVERAIALDPKFALAAWMQAMIAEAEGDAAGQLRASARCLEIAPSAGSCLRMRAHVNALSGDCPAVEADARRMVAVEPQSNRAYLQLARALASRGASQDAIWEVLQNQSKMLAERLRPEVEHEGRASLSALFGDFATAETELAAEEAALVSTSTESGHASMAMRVAVAREAGDFARAAKLAKELLDKKAGWIADDASFEGLMIANAVRGDALPRAQAELLRQHAIADLRKQLPPGVANAAWTWIYAWPAETPEEAREALGALPSFSPLPSGLAVEDLPLADGLIGKVYQLAGKTDEALPLLQRGAKSCNALSMPIEHTQLSFYLGQALETKGDTAGACAAYKTVLDRWSGAKPRSITLEKSRSRYMSLVCDKK